MSQELEKAPERLQRSLELAREFVRGYPAGKDERAKLLLDPPPAPLPTRCKHCGTLKSA